MKVHENLSSREEQVVQLLSLGLNTEEIAAQLHISAHTVISHRRNLMRKLDAKNCAHLIYKAIAHNYVPIMIFSN